MMILSPHAKVRRKQMRLTEHQLQEVWLDPEVIYPTRENRLIYSKGNINLVVVDGIVVTVLWKHEFTRDGVLPLSEEGSPCG